MCRSRRELSNKIQQVFTCKNRRRYSRERAPRSLGKKSIHYSLHSLDGRGEAGEGPLKRPGGRDPAGRGPARPPAGRGSEVSSARQQREVAEAEGAKTHASAQIDEATAQIATTGLDELMPPPPVVAAGYPTAEVRKIGPADCPAPARDRKNDFCRLSLSVIHEK